MGIYRILTVVWIFTIFSCGSTSQEEKESSRDSIIEKRLAKLNQPRPLIHNNDGCDVIYFPKAEKYSRENFLQKRTAGLLGSDVSTISFCPTSSGFGNFTYPTKVGEVFTKQGGDYDIRPTDRNLTAEMLEDQTDPIALNVEFAEKHGLEFFFSNRMNDTHDASHREDKPYLLWTEFKENNPEYLFGSIGERLPHGRWSSLSFDHPEVREKCVEIFEEVCNTYAVDGIELDFLRHFEYFASVARGEYASANQVELMTQMIRDIRKVADEAGHKRGKPILLLIRVPTDPDYAKKAGVDYQQWVAEGLVDIVVGSCYFRLAYWKNFIKIGENSPVKVYAGLSESRVKEEHPLLVRQQNAVFRARAAAAWQAGVDGIYSFNEYNTRVKYLSEIGEAEKLNHTNNLYFVTYRDYTADRYLKGGNDYFQLPRLSPSPGNHQVLEPGVQNKFTLELGAESEPAEIYVLTYTKDMDPSQLEVSIQDQVLTFVKTNESGLSVFKVSQSDWKGLDQIDCTIQVKSGAGQGQLKDVALFFCRSPEDLELQPLIEFCRS